MIIDYLPRYMRAYREIKEICKTEQLEINEINIYKDSIQKEFFIERATGLGLKKLENILGIISSDEEDIEYRKFRIRSKLAGTRKSLKEKLDELMPNGEYTLNMDIKNLTLNVKIYLTNEKYLESVKEMLEKNVPMNIAINCGILYTPHKDIIKYKYNELSEYTHKFIKEELYEQ